MTLTEKLFEKIVGNGENTGNQRILLFPQSFSTLSTVSSIINLLSALPFFVRVNAAWDCLVRVIGENTV